MLDSYGEHVRIIRVPLKQKYSLYFSGVALRPPVHIAVLKIHVATLSFIEAYSIQKIHRSLTDIGDTCFLPLTLYFLLVSSCLVAGLNCRPST